MTRHPKPPIILTPRGATVLTIATGLAFLAVFALIGTIEAGLIALPWEHQ